MQFDPRAIAPPLGEFSSALGWFNAFCCILGWSLCAWRLLRRRVSSADWVVWRRALFAGGCTGLAWLYAAAKHVELDPFVSLFLAWMLCSAFGAGFLVFASGQGERRTLGRRMIEAIALFVLGWPVPGMMAVVATKLGAW